MPSVLHLIAGFVMPLGLAFAGTPLAIRVANRFDFYDLPAGYKGHARPTPYLGGAAVAGAFVLGALVVAGHFDRTLPLVGGVLVLFAVGTFDDHRGLSPWPRLAVELMLAAALWALGDGWNLGLGWAPDLLVTLLWIAAVVNAFNLFDNMDGAAGSMAAVAAAGVAGLGVAIGDGWLTLTGAALCGACLGFLPHNMSRPARIFLGDGGSMPVGFAIGALVMSGASTATTEWQALAMGLLFVGIPAVDTAMVMFSRRRRRVPILTGGRDHLTHRMRTRLRTARAVALSLGGAQALLAALALMTIGKGSGALVACVALYLVAAGVLIGIIDAGYETSVPLATVTAPAGPGEVARARPRISLGSAAILVSLGVAAGLSPFYAAAYQPTRWAPIGLGLIAV